MFFELSTTRLIVRVTLCRSLAKKMNITWAEYWAFLDSFIDITTPDGLMKLESLLQEQAKKVKERKSVSVSYTV